MAVWAKLKNANSLYGPSYTRPIKMWILKQNLLLAQWVQVASDPRQNTIRRWYHKRIFHFVYDNIFIYENFVYL